MRFVVPPPMQARLDEYDGYHRASGNELCHFFGVPSIVAGAGTLLGALPFLTLETASITAAELVAAAVIVFYVISARALGVLTGALLALLVALGRNLPFVVGAGLFFWGLGPAIRGARRVREAFARVRPQLAALAGRPRVAGRTRGRPPVAFTLSRGPPKPAHPKSACSRANDNATSRAIVPAWLSTRSCCSAAASRATRCRAPRDDASRRRLGLFWREARRASS